MSYVRGYAERGIDFDAQTQTFKLARWSESAERFLDARFERVEDGRAWRLKPKTIAGQAAALARSVASRRSATPEEFARRRLSCFGDASTPACPALERTADGSYCSACKCGRWPLARLDGTVSSKLTFGYLECPLRRPGFSNEVTA